MCIRDRLDGGTHFYNTDECSDGEYVSIGSIEPQFYALLMEKANLSSEDFKEQNNPELWAQQKEALKSVFKQKTRDEWCALMEGTDVCFAPVLRFTEAPQHGAAVARNSYIEVDGVVQPAPAPRFSRTAPTVEHGAHANGEDTQAVLGAMGFGEQEIAALREAGAVN